MNTLIISSDKNLLNIEFIHAFISNTYWAEGRSFGEIQTCIDHSLNFGVYLNNQQIGYARVLTDYVAFAYLMDVFIAEEHQKLGYSNKLIDFILKHEALAKVKVWRLATTDAHYLYLKHGFTSLKSPSKMMEKIV